MRTYAIHGEDYSAEASWRLLDWCRARGVDAFSLNFVGPPYLPGSVWAEVDELLAPFRRRIASAGDRWTLTAETVDVLKSLLAEGLFARDAQQVVPLDPTFYRGETAFLSIATTDGTGVLRLKDDDLDSLGRSRLPVRPAVS